MAKQFDSLRCELDGINLVEAAAGTGKTYNIQNLAVRLILERRLPIESIVIVTFTKAATAELKSRIFSIISSTAERAALPPTAEPHACREEELLAAALRHDVPREECRRLLRRALMDFDRAAISTIHGFCTRLLRDYAFESGKDFNCEIEADDSTLIREFSLDFYRHVFNAPEHALQKEFFPWSREQFCTLTAAYLAADKSAPDGSGRVRILAPFCTDRKADELFRSMQQSADSACRNCRPGTLTALAEHVKKAAGTPETLAAGETFLLQRGGGGGFTPEQLSVFSAFSAKNLRAKVRAHHEEALEGILNANPGFFQAVDAMNEARQLYPGALLADAAAEIAARCRRRKEAASQMSNDDLIREAAEAVARSGEFRETLRNRLAAGIVDEFQDTDPLQFWIFKTLFGAGDGPLFLVGDPRQAIYKFRGGDLCAYLSAADQIPEERHHTLDVNFRSTGGLIAAVNTIFGGHPDAFHSARFSLPEIHEPEDVTLRHAPLLHCGLPDPQPLAIAQLPENTPVNELTVRAADMAVGHLDGSWRLPDGRPLTPADIAILTSSWDEGRALKAELQTRGLKAVVLKSSNVFSSADAAELLTFLRGAAAPGDNAAAVRALATPVAGFALPDFFGGGSGRAEEGCALLQELHNLWEKQSFAAMFRQALIRLRTVERYAMLPDGERKLTDLIQLGDLLHEESLRSGASSGELLRFFATAISESSQTQSDQYPQPMESDRSAVKILTIHGSKGLQYPVVILPSLDQIPRGISPQTCVYSYHDEEGRPCFDIAKSQGGKAQFAQEFADEARRLAYVAITRAQYRCIILSCGRQESVLDHLLNQRGGGVPIPDAWRIALPETSGRPASSFRPEPAGRLQNRTFHAQEQLAFWGTTSFTGLAPKAKHGPWNAAADESGGADESAVHDHDNDDDPLPRLKGPAFGKAVHTILEQIDYRSAPETQESVIRSAMAYISPAPEELAMVRALIRNVLRTPLPDGFRLDTLEMCDRCCELRFDYGFSGDLDRDRLLDMLQLPRPADEPPPEVLHGGIMTGSIDLLYRHGGKYHLIDWKTNRLDDYAPETLATVMAGEYYQLQLQLYMAALVRYLELRLVRRKFTADDYKTHVGSANYIFLRGVGHGVPGSGFYVRRPSFEELEATMELLQ